ncbi:MAG: ATP-binding protein [Acidobacteriota bacterium]
MSDSTPDTAPSSVSSLAPWAEEMRRLFRAEATSQFILHGAVHDLVAAPAGTGGGLRLDGAENEYVSLPRYLWKVMLEPFDVVVVYDRGRGIRVKKGGKHFHDFLRAFDAFRGTDWAKVPDLGPGDTALDLGNLLPRDAPRALELIHRFLRGSQNLTRREGGRTVAAPLRVAVVLEHAHFLAPRGEALQLSGEHSRVLIQLLEWASDPSIIGAFICTVLITDRLGDMSPALVASPYTAKIELPLPGVEELTALARDLAASEPGLEENSELPLDELAARLVGLTRVNARSLVLRAQRNGEALTQEFLTQVRKELIEKEASGLIEFVESERTLDDVAGHEEAKAWLREDAELMRRGITRALPMGYLLAGRIGTGKTFLVHCLAGEVGIPVVELKNFRDRWVGATEANLQKIFQILEALGRVIVFVDEADQATGKRDAGAGDSGLSGRVYGMLAKQMSETRNRGRILWIFATSRPDLLEVDLKRQGRLDVHIPLFPPADPRSRHQLFHAMARKVGLKVSAEELPHLEDRWIIGGNEMEGLLVRALRRYEMLRLRTDQPEPQLAEVVRGVIEEFRPSAHVERLELMDLLAVEECTDDRFLPQRFLGLGPEQVRRRIAELKDRLGEL